MPASKSDEYTKKMNKRSVSFETDLKFDSGKCAEARVGSQLRNSELFDRPGANWTESGRLTTRERRRICGE